MNIENNREHRDGPYKWFLLAFLWCAFFLHQGSRQLYNVIIPQIQDFLGVDSVKMGIAGTVFTLAYGLCAPMSGVASDMLRRKWMVVFGLLIFCSGIFFSGLASSIVLIVLFYGLLNGLGQAFYYPAACSLLSQLHEKTRATALAIHQTACYAGIVICSCASGYLGELSAVDGVAGWRLPFLIFGSFGIVLAIILAFCMRDTKPHIRSSKEPERASFKAAFFVMLKKPSAILLAFAFGAMVYVDVGFKTWMPTFLQEHFKMDSATAAFNAVVWHYAGAFIGVLLGSRVADKFVKKRKKIRFEANIMGLFCAAPFIYLMANTNVEFVCFVSLFFFGLFRGVYDSNLFASLFDVVPPRYRASASGLMLGIAFVFGSTAPIVLGWLRDNFSMALGIASLSGFYLLGAFLILIGRNFFFKKDYEPF